MSFKLRCKGLTPVKGKNVREAGNSMCEGSEIRNSMAHLRNRTKVWLKHQDHGKTNIK